MHHDIFSPFMYLLQFYYIQILYYIYAHGLIPDSLFSLSDPLFCISNKAYYYYYYYYYHHHQGCQNKLATGTFHRLF